MELAQCKFHLIIIIFVLAIDTQTSNPTLNGGAGEGEVKFFDGIIVERQM